MKRSRGSSEDAPEIPPEPQSKPRTIPSLFDQCVFLLKNNNQNMAIIAPYLQPQLLDKVKERMETLNTVARSSEWYDVHVHVRHVKRKMIHEVDTDSVYQVHRDVQVAAFYGSLQGAWPNANILMNEKNNIQLLFRGVIPSTYDTSDPYGFRPSARKYELGMEVEPRKNRQ